MNRKWKNLRLEFNLLTIENTFFEVLHAQNVETRADFIRALDVRNDLKAMEEEREQLQRKIERCKRRTNRRQDLGILLQMAERLRQEMERNQELQLQKQDQQKAVIFLIKIRVFGYNKNLSNFVTNLNV